MGPNVALWPRSNVPTEAELQAIVRELDRPFEIFLGDAGLDLPDLANTVAAIGFAPAVAVHACAYANAREDHRILGRIALSLSRKYDALIDFGGSLGDVTAKRGLLLTVPYNEGTCTFHIGDADFHGSVARRPALSHGEVRI